MIWQVLDYTVAMICSGLAIWYGINGSTEEWALCMIAAGVWGIKADMK